MTVREDHPPRGRGAAAARRPGADLLGLGAALALLAALSALLGGGEGVAEAPGDARLRAILLDRSASVTRGRPGWPRWAVQQLAAEARDAIEVGDDVLLVTFASGVERCFGPAPGAEFLSALRGGEAASWLDHSAAGDLGSDLEGASRSALEAIASGDRPAGSVVLLGDGRTAPGSPPAALMDPRVGELRLIPPPEALLADVGVRAAHVPARVEPGARVPVRLDLFIEGGLTIDGGAPAVIAEWELEFRSALQTVASRTLRGREEVPVPGAVLSAPGVRAFPARLELPPLTTGVGELRVNVRLKGLPAEVPDNFPENDRAAARLEVGNPVRVLLVSPAAGAGSRVPTGPLLGSLDGPAFDGVDFEWVQPADLRPRLLGEDPPQVVVTLDVPLAGLPGAALSRFVLSGGGWVRCAGWTALRDEGPELQPLLALVPDREPRRPMDVVLLVDGSGSMAGLRWERVRDALGAIVPTASDRDRMELRFFTQVVTQPQLVFEASARDAGARAAQRREAVQALLRARVPGGSTDTLYSLDGLAAAREERAAAESGRDPEDETEGLIVLITDGLTDSVWSLRRQVRARIEAAGDRLVVIQVGEDPEGVDFLSGLLMRGESVVEAGEMEALEDLLHQELQDVRLVEEATVREAPAGAEVPWITELREAAAEAGALERPLALRRALRSRPADGAAGLLDVEAELASQQRGTLIAVAERGQGTVAGLAIPSLGFGEDPWNPRLRSRLAWLAPVLRAMARRAEAATSTRTPGGGEPGDPPSGILTQGGDLVVRGVPDGLPASFVATLTGAPEVDLFGDLGPREPLGTVTLGVPPVAPDPDRVRYGPRPRALDGVPRGTPVLVELPLPASPVVVRADGPAEAFPEPGALVPPIFRGPQDRLERAPDLGRGAEDQRGWPHPLTPWLLWGAIGCLFLGALGGTRGLQGLLGARNEHSPGGQGSRSAPKQPNGTVGRPDRAP